MAPIHALRGDIDDITIHLECFCSWDTHPVTFVRLAFTNNNLADGETVFGLMPRAGRTSLLYGLAPDMYATYQPRLEHWDLLKNTWRFDGAQLVDGDHFIALDLQCVRLKWA